eukprot:gene12276-biopygen11164
MRRMRSLRRRLLAVGLGLGGHHARQAAQGLSQVLAPSGEPGGGATGLRWREGNPSGSYGINKYKYAPKALTSECCAKAANAQKACVALLVVPIDGIFDLSKIPASDPVPVPRLLEPAVGKSPEPVWETCCRTEPGCRWGNTPQTHGSFQFGSSKRVIRSKRVPETDLVANAWPIPSAACQGPFPGGFQKDA